ncbi:MAG: caspase family protein [Tannerellaceae bacterium]|jgi:hypothetical protein|nr:caspase family protein [Tannerellaceae bacterium]
MNRHLLTALASLLTFSSICAQTSDYEAWRRGKEAEYAKWHKLRMETRGLPSSPERDAISRRIDEAFGQAPAASPLSYPAPERQAISGMQTWVVIVGVADYANISKLNYTDDDAYRMYAFYKSPEGGALPDSRIRLLIDEDATRAGIIRAMDEVYAKASQNDAIIFFFSGHGGRSAFITREYDGRGDGNDGLLLHREIQDRFDRSPAKYKYVIADACHSGSLAASASAQPYYRAFDNVGGGFVLMLSSMGNEYSLEQSGIRQGIFSHFLIRGLNGEADANRDGIVSVVELFDFVKLNVVNRTNHRQTPVMSGNYQSNPPISIVRINN